MIDKELLDILVCPDNKTPLRLADEELVGRLNEAIAVGELKNRAGEPVKEPMDGGLVRQDRSLLYPIVDGIPILLVDEAIPLEGFQQAANGEQMAPPEGGSDA